MKRSTGKNATRDEITQKTVHAPFQNGECVLATDHLCSRIKKKQSHERERDMKRTERITLFFIFKKKKVGAYATSTDVDETETKIEQNVIIQGKCLCFTRLYLN